MSFTICSGIVADETMRHGHVTVDPDGFTWRMTHKTWLVLQMSGSMERVGDFLDAQTPGDYLIPVSLLRDGQAADLVRSLEMIEPEPSPTCIHPSCLQPTVTTRDGYPLCSDHDALLRDWDELLSQF